MNKEMMMWITKGYVTKGELNFDTGTVTFYDKFDNILVKRQGLSLREMKQIKKQIEKQLNLRSNVGFYYLPRGK